MQYYVGVRVEYDPLIRFVKTKEPIGHKNHWAIISTEFGDDMAKIVVESVEEAKCHRKTDYHLIRLANPEDFDKLKKYKADENDALNIIKKKVEEHKLQMKVFRAHYLFDKTKLLFFFYSENRVDFRELVKDLAGSFRTRIELRQVGPRDTTKMEGGLGVCGMEVCCHRMRVNFDAVTMKAAKDQNLSMNVNKISGICGRLLCCLTHENQMYNLLIKDFPRVESMIRVTAEFVDKDLPIENGPSEYKAIVKDFNVIKGTVLVRLETDSFLEIPLSAIKK